MSKKLSICICVFNKFNFTKSCLNDLSKLSNDHEIIVVDNGSTDETQSQLENSKEIIYYRHAENKGFAGGSNQAYSLSSANNVLFLNNDIRVKTNYSNWTQPLIEACEENFLVGPTMGQLDKDFNFIQEANRILPGKSYMSGWCLASSKEIWAKLAVPRNGPLKFHGTPPQIFSEEFGIAYFEDTDLGFRAKQLKIPLKIVEIPVVHFGKISSKQINVPLLYKSAREIFVKKWKNVSI